MSFFNYLMKIKSGTPINVGGFRKTLPEHVRENFYSYFLVIPVSAKLSVVEFKNDQDALDFETRFSPSENRVDAAMKGDSHGHGVETGYLLVYREGGHRVRPDVVVLSGDKEYLATNKHKDQVLLIENEENFFRYEKMLKFASNSQRAEFSLENTDVIFASGNRITKKILADWISSTYPKVLCAFDYDLGGLKIYQSLLKKVAHAEFLHPESWSGLEGFFLKEPEDSDALMEAIKLADSLDLRELGKTFHSTSRFMEQELILAKEFTL